MKTMQIGEHTVGFYEVEHSVFRDLIGRQRPTRRVAWSEIHNVYLSAIDASIDELALDDTDRRRHRSNDRLWAIHEWCQDRLAVF